MRVNNRYCSRSGCLKRRPHKYHFLGSLVILLILAALVSFVGYKTKYAEIQQAKADSLAFELHTTNQRVLLLASQNSALKEKLLESYANAPSPQVASLSRYYIQKYFGNEAPTAEKIFTCESGLNNSSISKPNKNHTRDWGISQINDATWQKTFENTFHVPFQTGALDFDMNVHMAKIIYDRSGNFSDWVCSAIVNT